MFLLCITLFLKEIISKILGLILLSSLSLQSKGRLADNFVSFTDDMACLWCVVVVEMDHKFSSFEHTVLNDFDEPNSDYLVFKR